MDFWRAAAISFAVSFIAVPIGLGILRLLGVYETVLERRCHVHVLFGRVVAIFQEPGLNSLWLRVGPLAPVVRILGHRYVVDLRTDQEYLRSQPVNSEEGAPMGIGVWYEMSVGDPVAYLFKNADPRGSLRASVSNAAVRCLSNLKLSEMMENRHAMSRTVRAEVSPQSQAWGYGLGSVYIRKVHFRDAEMIRQIEGKVVNRLRQVTAAIRQDGANQVSLISSNAEKEAAVEFAKAAAVRPRLVGAALQKIGRDPEIAKVLYEILEIQKLVESNAEITLIPAGAGASVLPQLLAAGPGPAAG